jgi:pimeloyl-ACP methyl ester carboxylesterase
MAAPPDLHVLDPESPDDAPTVVLVHGAMDRSASFGRMARHLDDLHVVRYDRRGYGRSAEAPLGDLDAHVDDLLGVIGERHVAVFGHSIGGVIALVAAARRPDRIRSLVAFEAPSPWASWWPTGEPPASDPADEAEAFMRRAIGDRFWSRLPARTRADRRAEGQALRADIASISGAAPFDPADVSVPVVVGRGSDTTWWHERAAGELDAALRASELVVVAGSSHGVHLSHPTAAASLVRRALVLGGLVPADQR